MKFSSEDMQRALDWYKEHSLDTEINVVMEGHKLILKANDKYGAAVEITLFNSEVAFQPMITKRDVL